MPLGASFTALTVVLNTTVPLEIAVVPPLVETSTVAAVVRVVVLESIKRTVSVGAEPFQFAAGTKRR